MRLEFHPAVQRDFTDAIDYYASAGGERLADRFEAEFRACLAAIRSAPRQFPFYQNSDRFRRVRLRHFPYVVIYREWPEVVRVTVLKHERRHPRFGMQRP